MARVLVVTGDVVPLGGSAATGAGLRTLGLGEGLRARGHHIVYAMPKWNAHHHPEERDDVVFYDPQALDALVEGHGADVVLFQHWPLVTTLSAGHGARIAIDFHGPLLLETLFRKPESLPAFIPTKLAAIQRADFFTCASVRQSYYFSSYLLLAGIDLRDPPLAVIPFSMSPDLPERAGWPAPPVFVYGGVFLPWQDPSTGLRVLVDELESRDRGTVRFYGGKHPWMQIGSEGSFDVLRRTLERSSRVSFQPTLPRTELIEAYTRASVAWDVMAKNVERDLAFTSRTVEYLWCGLPVVYNDYAELADYIRDADAGWTVDPEDEAALREVVREILDDPATVERKGANARELVRSRLAWDATIDPLDAFCRSPRAAGRLFVPPPLAVTQPLPVRRPSVSRRVVRALVPASVRAALRRRLGRLPRA